MIKCICSMLDRKSGFDAVQIVDNVELAKRAFGYAVNNDGIPSYAPADFELYKVGEFDTKTGELMPIQPIELICTGLEVFGDAK